MSLNKHDYKKIFLILATILFYVSVLVLNQFAARKKFFPNDVGSVSRQYSSDITPPGYVFGLIWPVIFVWQTVWLVYTFVTLFRRLEDGALIYRKINLFHSGFFLAFILNILGMAGWLFLWTNKLIGPSAACLFLLTLSLLIAFYINLKNFYSIQYDLYNLKLQKDVWLNRILVQNGLAFYLTWVTIATNLNFSTYLTYDLGIERTISSTIVLAILALIITFYFIVENFVWQKYLLYVFAPWLVLMIGLSGSLLNNWPKKSNLYPTRNNILTLVILSSCVLYSIVKVVMFSLYHTICKQQVDKKESHKLLQLKQNQMNNE